ncbi:Holliday junction branch migration protein RuvA [Candidatus Saccharibacteria bacterium]|nr:Holliday junction branch migration protein RuvA [Candidatus Saccharibacteria bacterium]
MIALITGRVVEKTEASVIVDVHGVGYEIMLSAPELDKITLNDDVKLHTYHHIREQSQELFGFSSLAAKKLFELLISVQGVGPKAAMAILSVGESEAVRSAIANSDVVYIARAAGVGKKSAERVIVDLKDKVGVASNLVTGNSVQPQADEALEALMALGYNLNDAAKALENIDKALQTGERVKAALQQK